MGAIEEGSKVAASVIESLKSAPVVLAVLLFNILYMALGVYSQMNERGRWENVIEKTLQACVHDGEKPQ